MKKERIAAVAAVAVVVVVVVVVAVMDRLKLLGLFKTSVVLPQTTLYR